MFSNVGQVQCTFFGTTSLYFTDGITGIFIDAFLTRSALSKLFTSDISPDPELIRETLQRGGVENLDAIFVAHSHFDHAMDSPEVIKQLGGKMYGSESTLNIGRGEGLREDQMQAIKEGDEYVFGNFKVRMFEGEHSPGNTFPGHIDSPLCAPAKASAYLDGGCYSFHITHPSGTILVHPSANYVPGKFSGVTADVLYLGIGVLGMQSEDFQEKYWHETVEATRPRVIIPIHWDNFGEPLSKPLEPLPAPYDKFEESKAFIERKKKEDGYVVRWQDALETFRPFEL